jgi:hypothetical protein
MIRCGNCKNPHQSVRAVRMCYDTVTCIWQIPAAFGFMVGSYGQVLSMDEAISEGDEFAAQQAGEIWAESKMSWVAGGGSCEDANFYASVMASGQTWEGYLAARDEAVGREIEAAGLCDHGLSAALCQGPEHYGTYEDERAAYAY